MIEHNELAKEMENIEKLPRNDRVKLAFKRRKEQLATHTKWIKSDEYASTIKTKNTNCKGIKFSEEIQLMDIASRNSLEEMRAVLKTGVDPNQTNHDDLTALHQCCIDGSLEMVNLLIKHGANVNVKDMDLWTPLHAAATCGHFKIVTLLIKAGANLTAMNGDGDMPHDIAEDQVMRQYLENEMAKQGLTDASVDEIRGGAHAQLMIDINDILSRGGDINQPLDQGGTFLHVAIAYGYNDIVSHLLHNKASVTARDEDGWEPVHVAAYWSNDNALDMVLEEAGVDLRALTDNGETPLDLCEETELKGYIIRRLSDISLKYGSVKNYMYPELQRSIKMDISDDKSDNDNESSTRFDDYEDTVSDTLVFNLPRVQTISQSQQKVKLNEDYNNNDNEGDDTSEDEEDQQNPITPVIIPTNPLLNLDASELSERRNSVREAKHLAHIKRSHSIDKSHQPINIIPESTEKLSSGDSSDDQSELNRPNTSSFNYSTGVPKPQDKAETSSYTIDHITLPKVASTSKEDNSSLERSRSNTETSEHKVTPNGIVASQKPQASPQEQPKEPLQPRRRTKKMAPPPPPMTRRTTLLDLKKQRQEARQTFMENQEEGSSTTFYDITNIYQPPPSPTMIRYRLKMTDEITQQTIIKEKKCSIM